ncbi:MAG: sulfatase-like hydrolase/transferase [Draconibacterium sp.]|nr:sulfatase-like hydrolase/transferase [Draconibacterium sp.]
MQVNFIKNNYRMTILKIFLGLFLLGSLNCSKELKETQEDSTFKPNLLIIQTDEHNFRTLGCYREQLSHEQAFMWGDGINVETPNIDYLAKNGVLFTKYYAATPVCSPSRGTLISGMYPQHTGVPKNDLPLNDNIVSYSEVLGNNGYKTGFIGKWHLDGTGKPQWEPERDFGFADNRYMYNRGHWKKLEDTPQGPIVAASNANGTPNYDLDGADETTFTTDFLTDKTIEFIEKNKDDPFSMYLSYPDPHGPDRVRPPYDAMYTGMNFEKPRTFNLDASIVPSWAKPEKNPKLTHDQYFGMIKCIDDNIGRLITYLREKELLDKTIIVFTSDHGDLRAEHGKHNKGNPLEASAKIPFVVYYPAKIPVGKVVNNAFNTVDFAPTFLNFMNQKVPSQMEGRDFSELLINPENQDNWDDLTFMRSTGLPGEGNWVAAVTSRYKLILSKSDEPWLIDMETDPDELVNFINESAKSAIVKELANKLNDYSERHSDPFLQGTKMADDLKNLM